MSTKNPCKALVVGGTSGIGRGLAEYLATQGCSVCVAGRSVSRGEQIVKELEALTPVGTVAVHRFSQIDCFDLGSVKKLASDTIASGGVDYLVLSQGMATLQGFTPTVDRFDQKLCLHVYSRIVLASLLAPTLAQSPIGGRVLSVLSAGVHGTYPHWESDPTLKDHYSTKNAADAAGLYNDICLDHLARAHPGVNFTHAAPGFVATAWGTEMPFPVRWLVRGLQLMGKSRQDCGRLLGDGWLRRGPGFFLMGERGGDARHTGRHAEICESGFWAEMQSRLKEWLE